MGIKKSLKKLKKKVLHTIQSLSQGAEQKDPLQPFRMVQIQTTSVCNGKCIICPYPESWHFHNPGRMTDAVFDAVLSQLAPLKLDKICPYLENEPFADPAIFERTEEIFKRCTFKHLEFSTNALLLDAEKQKHLADLLQSRNHEIWISFHGVNKASYEGVMGLPFDKALSNVISLLHLADEAGLKLVIRCAGMGCDSKLSHGFQCTKEEFDSFWEGIFLKNSIRQRPRMNYFKFHDRAGSIQRNGIRMPEIVRPDLSGFDCIRVSQWLHVLYTGELILCCMDYHRKTVFGDIRAHSLKNIIKSRPFRTLRDSVRGKRSSGANFICKRCVHPGG